MTISNISMVARYANTPSVVHQNAITNWTIKTKQVFIVHQINKLDTTLEFDYSEMQKLISIDFQTNIYWLSVRLLWKISDANNTSETKNNWLRWFVFCQIKSGKSQKHNYHKTLFLKNSNMELYREKKVGDKFLMRQTHSRLSSINKTGVYSYSIYSKSSKEIANSHTHGYCSSVFTVVLSRCAHTDPTYV